MVSKLKYTFALVLLAVLLVSTNTLMSAPRELQATQDTAQVDTVKQIPGYYKHVDVKITYSWKPDSPEWYRNVNCQVVKKNGTVEELKIFLKTCTERVTVKEGLITFEVRDRESKKILAKGP